MLSDEEIISLNRMKLFARSSDLSVVSAKDMDIVVTLVEKQSKEIEELKNNELDYTTIYINGVYEGKKYYKDKIKAKIEELENDPNNIEEHNCLRADTCYVINILQSLLEKE